MLGKKKNVAKFAPKFYSVRYRGIANELRAKSSSQTANQNSRNPSPSADWPADLEC